MEDLNELLTGIKKKLAALENDCIKRNEKPQLIDKRKAFLIVEELRGKLYLTSIEKRDLIFLLIHSLYYLKSDSNNVVNWFEDLSEDIEL